MCVGKKYCAMSVCVRVNSNVGTQDVKNARVDLSRTIVETIYQNSIRACRRVVKFEFGLESECVIFSRISVCRIIKIINYHVSKHIFSSLRFISNTFSVLSYDSILHSSRIAHNIGI